MAVPSLPIFEAPNSAAPISAAPTPTIATLIDAAVQLKAAVQAVGGKQQAMALMELLGM